MAPTTKRERAQTARDRCADLATTAADINTRITAAYWHGRLAVLTEQAGFTSANVIDDNITMATHEVPGFNKGAA